MAHKHASLMLQYAADAASDDAPWRNWQYKLPGDTAWNACTTHPDWSLSRSYRRKPAEPDTVAIRGQTIPKGVRAAPIYGTRYWHPSVSGDKPVYPRIWRGEAKDLKRLQDGIVYMDRDDALKMANVLRTTARNGC